MNRIVSLVRERYEIKSIDNSIISAIGNLIDIKAIDSTGENGYYITQLGIGLLHEIMKASKKLAL